MKNKFESYVMDLTAIAPDNTIDHDAVTRII